MLAPRENKEGREKTESARGRKANLEGGKPNLFGV
jgi:hypothetical protein